MEARAVPLMEPAILVPLLLTATFSGAFVANEMTQGAVAEWMGAGHHHWTTRAGHCDGLAWAVGSPDAPCHDAHHASAPHDHDGHDHHHASNDTPARPGGRV